MNKIPGQYKNLWKEFGARNSLVHLTTESNLESIRKTGFIEPRDPAPRNWAGMRAVFMGDPEDPMYQNSLKNVGQHVQNKGQHLVRLHIKTKNKLFKCLDPERTFQVISLEPISSDDIVDIESIE